MKANDPLLRLGLEDPWKNDELSRAHDDAMQRELESQLQEFALGKTYKNARLLGGNDEELVEVKSATGDIVSLGGFSHNSRLVSQPEVHSLGGPGPNRPTVYVPSKLADDRQAMHY